MKPEGAKVCPACGTRNKAKWEICVSCGESLEGVPLASAAAAPAPTFATTEEQPGSPVGAWLLLVLMLGIGAGVVFWVTQRTEAPENTVDPAIFAVGSPPPSAQPARPEPTTDLEKTMDAAMRLIAQSDFTSASRLLAPLIADNANNARLRWMYGRALFGMNNREDALREFQTSAEIAPDDPEFGVAYAGALQMTGRSDDAVAEYQKVIERSPRNVQALQELGSLLNRLRRFGAAVAPLQQAAEIRPNDMVILQDLAWALGSSGQTDAAKAAYQRLVQTAPDATLARTHLADLMFRQGEREQALQLLDEGLKRDANAPLLRRARASALEKLGRIDEAIAEYRAYAKIAPNADDARALSDRADMLEKRRGSS
jgi:Flp pilus assembly protein TadD